MPSEREDLIRAIANSSLDEVRCVLKSRKESPILNIAIGHNLGINHMRKLIEMISNENGDELCDQQRDTGETALHKAMNSHYISNELIELLIEKKPELVTMRYFDNVLPVNEAARLRQRELTIYLHHKTSKEEVYSLEDREDLIKAALSAGWYDLTMKLLKDEEEDSYSTWCKTGFPLHIIADESSYFRSTASLNMLQSLIYYCISEKSLPMGDLEEVSLCLEVSHIQNLDNGVILKVYKFAKKIWRKLDEPIEDIRAAKIRHERSLKIVEYVFSRIMNLTSSTVDYTELAPVLYAAAENGISELVQIFLKAIPNATTYKNVNRHFCFDFAAMHRHEKIFRMALQGVPYRYFHAMDKEGKYLLHRIAGKALQQRLNTGPRVVFQMQRELRWYKEIENLVPAQSRLRDANGKLPIEVFKEEHKDLIEYENKWITEMATSCIVGGSLIVTIAFASAITVPGGNHSETGLPIFSNKTTYHIFFISNMLSLIFSLTSVLIFLSIFTAHHSLDDHLYSLPRRIIFGLSFFFLSLTSLMVDFTSIACLVSSEETEKDIYITVAFSCIPVGFFAYLQLPSLINMISSTFGQRSFIEDLDSSTKRYLRIV